MVCFFPLVLNRARHLARRPPFQSRSSQGLVFTVGSGNGSRFSFNLSIGLNPSLPKMFMRALISDDLGFTVLILATSRQASSRITLSLRCSNRAGAALVGSVQIAFSAAGRCAGDLPIGRTGADRATYLSLAKIVICCIRCSVSTSRRERSCAGCGRPRGVLCRQSAGRRS
jgi:hypothetical protein